MQIISQKDGKVADIEGGQSQTKRVGTPVIVFSSHGGVNQRWKVDGGQIINPYGNLVMEADNKGDIR